MVRRCFPVAKIAGSSPVWVGSTFGINLLTFLDIFEIFLIFFGAICIVSGVGRSQASLGIAT